MRTWLKVTALLPSLPDDWAVWADLFARHGLPGTVQTDDPPTMSAYVPPGDESLSARLIKALESSGARVTIEDVEEIDWSESWKQFFKPISIGERFLVRPTWEESESGERIEIVLDPGQAFGTGDHPTTRLCLQLMEKTDIAGKIVADVGCGSGILSVAAMKLGARSVDAVDVDGLSVEATRENADRNNVSLNVYEGAGFDPLEGQSYDIVVSNIISAAIIGLTREAASRTRETWIVSGIIGQNWPAVEETVTASGFHVDEVLEEGDWVAARLLR